MASGPVHDTIRKTKNVPLESRHWNLQDVRRLWEQEEDHFSHHRVRVLPGLRLQGSHGRGSEN